MPTDHRVIPIMNKIARTKMLRLPIIRCIQVIVMLLISLYGNYSIAATYLVDDISAYKKAVVNLEPGDTVVLKNKIWMNFEILFEGNGTAEQPITLKAETKGKVIISGESNLRLAGKHLVVSGLVFKNGYTPTSAVIAFRKNKTEVANNSRVTETVIDHFNNPERFENDSWVAMYGKNNRFDHNHLEGKSNKGVTMAVRLNTDASRENHHRIDHNYFGPRSILGANGGETLRVGTSHYSLSDSNTVVENNYFDRCDGELEIISNKSGNNKYIGNVFFQSRGTLTMRHGNDTLVENNVFFGNGADHTGGIRVINKRQTIRNNYLEGIAGYRFGGALVVMNGVPNSPINRYHQVEDSVIENNSLVDALHIQLAAGSDLERSAIPLTTTFKNNLIYSKEQEDPFTVYDDISGISFSGNQINVTEGLQMQEGFIAQPLELSRAKNGLMYATKSNDIEAGVSRDLSPIGKDQTGVDWYPKPDLEPTFDQGEVINVEPGLDTLATALKTAGNGDVLSLDDGEYTVSRVLVLDKAITIKAGSFAKSDKAKSKSPKVRLSFERGALFEIRAGGNLKLSGLEITGAEAPDSSGNAVIRTQRRSMLSNYELIVEDTNVVDLNINHSFDFLRVAKGTFADRIIITNSKFKNITGAILALDKESDDYGIYNAEYVTIHNSEFESIQGDLVDYYRGGTDESTFGPHFVLSDSLLTKVGMGKRNKSKSAILLHGVQVSRVRNNRFVDTAGIKVKHTVGEPITHIHNNQFVGTPEINVVELNSDKENTALLFENVYNEQTLKGVN